MLKVGEKLEVRYKMSNVGKHKYVLNSISDVKYIYRSTQCNLVLV